MKVHVLPGMDPKTEQWANSLVQELGVAAGSATVQRYLHWESADASVQREAEIEKLKGCSMSLLIGKSLGVGLGLRACIKGIIQPEKAVFIGTPLTSLVKQGHDLKLMVQQAGVSSLYIQQKDDPLGGAASLQESLPETRIIEVAGSDHQYNDIKQLIDHIHEWLRNG